MGIVDLHSIRRVGDSLRVMSAEPFAFRLYQNPIRNSIFRWILDRGVGSKMTFLKTWVLIPGCSGLRGREDSRRDGTPEAWLEGIGFVEIEEQGGMGIITLR